MSLPFPTKLLAVAAMTITLGVIAPNAAAQYFKVPIKVIVPYAAGGGTDGLARLLGQGLLKEFGQPVVIENKPDASGQIGTQFVQAAAPNCAKLLFTVDHSLITLPLTSPAAKYDALADFTALGLAAHSQWTLSIPATGASKDFVIFAATAKAEPAQRSYGVSFVGGAPTVIGDTLGRNWGSPMAPVPFSVSVPVIQNVIAGQIPAGITGMPEAMAVHRSGKARVIAVSGANRAPLLPDVPIFKELGVDDLEFHTFLGFFAPNNLPPEMAAEFNAALRKVLAEPSVLERLSGMSLQPAPTPLTEAREEVLSMNLFWQKALDVKR